MRQVSLSGKLSLIILSAILIPLILLGVTSFISARSIAIDNLEAFVTESGSRRLQAIEKEFNTALFTLQEFIPRRQITLARALRDRNDGTVNTNQSTLETGVASLFSSDLIQSGYFNSVSLITSDGLAANSLQPFAAANSPTTAPLSYNPQNSTNIRNASNNLQDNVTLTLVISTHSDNVHIELLQAIFSEDSEEITGYLLADLNLETIVYANLVRSEELFDTNAYLLFPFNNNAVISDPEGDDTLVDRDSSGANRLRANASGTGRYSINTSDGERIEVLGYSGLIETDIIDFGIVAEVSTVVISQQLLSQALSRIFPLVVGGTSVLIIFLLLISNQLIVSPIRRLRQAIVGVVRGNFDEPVPDINRLDEIGDLASSFVDMREYVRTLIDDMNRQLRERTRDVQVTQGIGRAITAEHNVQQLMERVVQLIVDNFPSIYHAQIFIIDTESDFAVLRASTGQAGIELLSRGHKLAVGSVSVIGQVTEQGQMVIARDASESDLHRRNEFLQETLAELAVPLRLGNQIIGALDVQSKQRDAFDPDQVSALQTLADQVTIAIENARLYAESERLLSSMEERSNTATRKNWQQHLFEQRQNELQKRAGTTTDYNFATLSRVVYESGKAVVGNKTERNTIPFAVPIILRGQVLGVVEYEVPQADFSYDKVLLAEELVTRMAIGLENARLFQTSQQAADRERIVNEISAKLTGQTDIDLILQTAVEEIGQALRTPQVAIRLKSKDTNGSSINGVNQNGSSHGTSTEQS